MTPGGRDEKGEPIEKIERAQQDAVPAVAVSGRELEWLMGRGGIHHFAWYVIPLGLLGLAYFGGR